MPTAGPQTAASKGLGNVLMARKKRNTGDSCVDGGPFKKSAISFPALNTVSCPWKTTTRTSGLASACCKASAISAYMAEVIEFFLSIRLNVMVITPASVWVKMSLFAITSLIAVLPLQNPNGLGPRTSGCQQKKWGHQRYLA